MEPFYPLRAFVCSNCLLVQLEQFETPDHIFGDYAYFSSYSTSWLEHSRRYVEQMIERFGLGADSQVVELASNDGYLLQYFRERADPRARHRAGRERRRGRRRRRAIPTLVEFFGRDDGPVAGRQLARRPAARQQRARPCPGPQRLRRRHEDPAQAGRRHHHGVPSPDAPRRGEPVRHHLPRALQLLLVPDGQPRVRRPRAQACSTSRSCRPTGARCASTAPMPTTPPSRRPSVSAELVERERAAGYDALDIYRTYAQRVQEEKRAILSFLIELKHQGLSIAGYGAPAKGNTLLNFCGVGTDFIDYTVDHEPAQAGTPAAGQPHPHSRPRGSHARPSPTSSSSCPGTSATRSWSNTPMSAVGQAGLRRAPQRCVCSTDARGRTTP